MDRLNMHYAPVTAIGGMMLAQTAADHHVPLEYYVATLSVFGLVITIIKGYNWAEKKVKEIVQPQFATYEAKLSGIEDHLSELRKVQETHYRDLRRVLLTLPCARIGVCDDRGFARPAITPVGLPAVELPPPQGEEGGGPDEGTGT